MITLCCPKCNKQLETERLAIDPPEAVKLLLTCDKCWNGDFEEIMYFDAEGNHLLAYTGVRV